MSVKLYLDTYEDEFFVAEGLMSQRWNGWQIPFFTKKQAFATWEKLGRLDCTGATYTYDDAADEFVYDFEGQISRYGKTRIKRIVGKNDFSYDGYSLGGQEWCWTIDNGDIEVE